MPGPARRPWRRRRALGAAGALLVAAAALLPAACADVGTGPADAVSVSFDSLPPSIVAGDVLRDANGDTLRLRTLAKAYNGRGGVIDSAPFSFLYVPARTDSARRRDSLLVVVDSSRGVVRAPAFAPADTVGINDARLGARLGPVLQLLRTIRVVQPPDTLVRLAADTALRIRSVPDNLDTNTSPALTVRVLRDSGSVAGTQVGVPRYLVRYRVLGAFGDSAALLVLGSRQSTTVLDTTDAGGQAGPRLRLRPSRFTGAVPGTIPVEVSALRMGVPLAGSPDTVRVPVCRRGDTGC
jgi:hypothetical protein